MSAWATHLLRDLGVLVTGIVAFLVAATIVEGAGFAAALLLIVIALGALAIPALVIWFDRHDSRFRHYGSH